MDERIVEALLVASNLHCGQKYNDEPYINHVVRVAERVKAKHPNNIVAICVALLHDTLEDTSITEVELSRMFGEDIASSVFAITRKRGEKYFSYIDRLSIDPIARIVKVEDLRENLYQCGLPGCPLSKKPLSVRYAKAIEILRDRMSKEKGA